MPVGRKESFGQSGRESFVFLSGFLDHSTSDQILQLFVGAKPEHFLTTAGRIAGPKVLMQDLEKLFELERCPPGKNCNQFFGNEIRHSAGKSILF